MAQALTWAAPLAVGSRRNRCRSHPAGPRRGGPESAALFWFVWRAVFRRQLLLDSY